MAEHRGISDDTFKSIAFMGNPGTGKTSLARIVSKIYSENGITNGVFIETSRAELVGRWLGETSQKVKAVFQKAQGGILFVDEAGNLITSDRDSYGIEALGAIVKHMDNHPETIVIFATYSQQMEMLFETNEGLRSRCSNIIEFESYDTEQLVQIFKLIATERGYTVAGGYKKIISPYFDKIRNNDTFGNGRDARKLVEAAIGVLAVQSKEFTTAIPLSAIRKAVQDSLESQPAAKNVIGFQQG